MAIDAQGEPTGLSATGGTVLVGVQEVVITPKPKIMKAAYATIRLVMFCKLHLNSTQWTSLRCTLYKTYCNAVINKLKRL